MSDDSTFLAAINTAPADNTPRLVYADWLEEQGRPAEFLRIECEIAELDPGDYWQRVHSVAKLRCAIRGLDDEWMAAVSRVSIEEIYACHQEIQSWLRRRVTVAELLAHMAEWDKVMDQPRTLWQRVRRLFRQSIAARVSQPEGSRVRWMREWIESNFRPGDELWQYNSGDKTWAHLCGRMGYAIVRDGKVVEFEMLMMN